MKIGGNNFWQTHMRGKGGDFDGGGGSEQPGVSGRGAGQFGDGVWSGAAQGAGAGGLTARNGSP